MVSLLDCIQRVPQTMETIMEKRHENMAALFSVLDNRLDDLDEVVLVASGTSNTASITSKFFIEKVVGVRTISVYPNDFRFNTHHYNPNALYVFTSQTGTSSVVRDAQQMIRDKGYLTVSITESPETPIAKESQVHVDMHCGHEEYSTRTIGYCASVFTHMVMALELGLRKGSITQREYDEYFALAKKVPDSHRSITPRAMEWMDTHRQKMMRSECLVFTGAGALQGVAQEAAVKVWEIPRYTSFGYELEEGMHGANFGYNHNHCVIVLNNGGRENEKALALARWVKDVYKNGFVIGSQVVDETDLAIDLKGGDFACLEVAPAVQVLAYRMATDQGIDLFTPQDHSVMRSYFTTHDKKDK